MKNERIRELIEQAGMVYWPNKELDRFAELIVRECCFTGEQWADGLLDPKHYAFVNKQIKNHFGVEE